MRCSSTGTPCAAVNSCFTMEYLFLLWLCFLILLFPYALSGCCFLFFLMCAFPEVPPALLLGSAVSCTWSVAEVSCAALCSSPNLATYAQWKRGSLWREVGSVVTGSSGGSNSGGLGGSWWASCFVLALVFWGLSTAFHKQPSSSYYKYHHKNQPC